MRHSYYAHGSGCIQTGGPIVIALRHEEIITIGSGLNSRNMVA